MSYIAGAITGHPDVKVSIRNQNGELEFMSAPDALKRFDIEKIVMGPKEGLGLINGTAISGELLLFTFSKLLLMIYLISLYG